MFIEKGTPCKFNYTDRNGKRTTRTHLFPVSSKAMSKLMTIDITELTGTDRDQMIEAYNEYIEWLNSRPVLSFEDFVEQTRDKELADLIKPRVLDVTKVEPFPGE